MFIFSGVCLTDLFFFFFFEFLECFYILMCKHHKESDYLHGHGDPDRLYAKPGGAGGTESGTDRKNQNNKSTVDAFVFHRRIFADMVQAEIFGRTSHISDAHGCCTWNTAEFAEGIDLHGTGERKHDVCDHIEGRFIRQKSGDPENQDFYDQNNLPQWILTLVL